MVELYYLIEILNFAKRKLNYLPNYLFKSQDFLKAFKFHSIDLLR